MGKWVFVPNVVIYGEEPKERVIEYIKNKYVPDVLKNNGTLHTDNVDRENELEDALLMAEPFECKSSLVEYWESLKDYGIVGRGQHDALLSVKNAEVLMNTLHKLAVHIRNNTDRLSHTKNHIMESVYKVCDEPIIGLIAKILIFQGLSQWMQKVAEHNGGSYECRNLCDWLQKRLHAVLAESTSECNITKYF